MEATSYDVLVIILSITLAVFLVMSIVALTYIIQILKKAKAMTEKAESFVENVESAGKMLKNSASSAGFFGAISNVINSVKRSGGNDGE